jgi:hypothetical protein
MKIHEPVIVSDGGPWAEHDMACAVCHEETAVLDIGTGVFHPCWRCARQGWEIRGRRFGRKGRAT